MSLRFRNVFADPTQETDPIIGGFRRALSTDNPPDDTGEGSTVNQPDPNVRKRQQDDIYEQTLRALSTAGPNQTKYANFVANAPKEADYQPNMYTRIAAAVSGAGAGMRNPTEGVRVAQQIRDDPYNTAVRDYELRGKGLGVLAQQEESTRANQLGLIKALRDDAYKSREMTNNERKTDIEGQNANTMSGYRKAQEDKMQRDGWVFSDNDKGNRIAQKINTDGTVNKIDMGPSLAATTIRQKDREIGQTDTRLGIEGRMAGAAERNAGANETRAGQSFSPPSQQIYADVMAAKQVVREHPEWAGFIDSNGQVKQTYSFGRRISDPNFQTFQNRVKQVRDEIIKNNRSASPFGSMFDIKDDQ